MKKETVILQEDKGAKVFLYKWLPESEPKAVLQVSHGMVETALRYERFAQFLTYEGYAVYAQDHLGHGLTAPNIEAIGVLEKDDFERMVDTLELVGDEINKDFPKCKRFLLGHSMGSFIAQRYIQRDPKRLAGVILSGTAGKAPELKVMKVLVNLLTYIKGSKARAYFLNKVQFGGYNKAFAPNRTPTDWISSDEKEVEAYIANPYCGAVITYGFFQCLLEGLSKIHKKDEIEKVPKDLPIHLISGSRDPVGNFTKSVTWLVNEYQALGIKSVTHHFYPGRRHEMLNEINRDEVMGDLLEWLEEKK